MKKSALALILAVLMAVGLLTIGAAADDGVPCEGGASCNHVAAIDDTHYDSLAAAVTAAKNDDTITLLKSTEGSGVQVIGSSERTLTIDLNNCTYTIVDPTVGSSGTETNGFQLLKGSTVTIKDGQIQAKTSKARILFQNYCNLTLDNVTVDCTGSNCEYVSSNNCGNVVIRDSTLIAAEGQAAFDVYYWPKNGYTEGVTVTVEGDSVITGRIEYGGDETTESTNVADYAKLNITGGTFTGGLVKGITGTSEKAGINVTGGTFVDADGEKWGMSEYVQPGMKQDENGTIVIDEKTAIATVDDSVGYTTLEAALAAAKDGQTVTLLESNTPSAKVIEVEDKNITLDLGNNVLTAQVNVSESNLTIKNGTIESPLSDAYLDGGAAVYVMASDDPSASANDCVLNVESTALLHGYYGILVSGPTYGSNAAYGATINVEGTVYGPIFVAGNIGNKTELQAGSELVTINIENGAYLDGNEAKGDDSAAIVQSGETVLNICDGATLVGTEAIAMKRGSLNIEGGTFIGNGDKIDPAVANNNGSENTGSAISVTSTYAKNFNVLDINISGGTFKSDKNAAVYVGHSVNNKAPVGYRCNIVLDISGGTFISADDVDAVYIAEKIDADTGITTTNKVAEKFISNGSFSSSVTAYLVDGFNYELKSGDGMFSYYSNFEDALAAAENDSGAVITYVGSSETAAKLYTVTIVYGNGTDKMMLNLPAGSYKLPAAPSKPGYIFLGWRNGGTTYGADDTYTLSGDMTFTAVWANMPDVTPSEPDDEPDDEPDVTEFPFDDVSVLAWYYDAVKYVYDNDLMNGTDVNQFSPNSPLTRAMVWAVLARVDGETISGDSWMTEAQAWAVESGVSDGTDPTGYVTREQLVTMLYRFAGEPAGAADISGYPDAASISDWAADAMAWAVKVGLIEGDDVGALNPTANSTRAHAATFFMRFCER